VLENYGSHKTPHEAHRQGNPRDRTTERATKNLAIPRTGGCIRGLIGVAKLESRADPDRGGAAMRSLRSGIQKLLRFPQGHRLNVSEVAEFVHMDRPISVAALSTKLDSLPDFVRFHSTIVTGTALGGEVTITLNRDGSYQFSGFMRATGFPSFSFRVGAVVRSASNQVTVAAQHSGKVFGTDTPGDRQNNWDEKGTDLAQMKLIRNIWPDISAGTLVVSRSSEVAGVLGAAGEVLKDVAEFFVVAETLGPGLAACFLIGSELQQAGVSLPGLGGVVGLGIVGGSVFIFGPSAIVPATIFGVAAGAVVDSMVKLRPLRDDEIAFARQVFGDSLDFGRVRLTNLSGLGTRAFTAPTLDGTILVNIGNAIDSPSTAVFPNYPVPGQILIHELTHAWQIQHASLADGFVPGLMCQGILNQTVVSKPYEYGPPGQPWSSFNLEAQAAIVDQWFGGNGRRQSPPRMNLNSPYVGYINNNVRLGAP
jgi:hypothetical protein